VQNPAARHARREERIMQLFRLLNTVLERRKETRQRNLFFHMPLIIPLSTSIRIIQDDPSYVSLEDVYEDHCEKKGIHPDQPILMFRDKLSEAISKYSIPLRKGNSDLLNLRLLIMDKISSAMISDDILQKYMEASIPSFSGYYLLRKNFTLQYSSFTFLSYVMSIGHRFPHKMLISREKGTLFATDLLPSLNHAGQFTLTEAVPFRLTPSIQNYMTPVGMEGIYTSGIMSIARCLIEPEFELEDFLSIFIRDELITWHHGAMMLSNMEKGGENQGAASSVPNPNIMQEQEIRVRIAQNVDLVLKRAQTLSCIKERENAQDLQTPVNQTLLDLISCAVNPQKLAQMDAHWHPWL
jgi:transformation/transcription domain-associated protein